ncbi:MAG: purine/pyrimidine permease [Tuberibacillus sp.]
MGKTTLASFQWMVFILAGTIVAPVSVAYAFGFNHAETADLLQRTFFVVGITTLLQGLFGHKLPLMEGPAGLWWGVFLTYAGMAAHTQGVLSSLEMGLIAAGLLFVVLSVFNLIKYVQMLFTPAVTGTYLILLIVQLSGPFISGILGADEGRIDGKTATAALITLVLSILMSQSRIIFLKNYSVLISLIFGWILFALFGLSALPSNHLGWVTVPRWFVWGTPSFNAGIFITSLLTALLLLTNMIASVEAVKQVVRPKKMESMRKTSLIMGINQILAGVFPTVGGVPISGSAGFILTTRIKERLPFLIGTAIILVMSFFPVITAFFASLPAPVGYATLFVSMAGILGLGMNTVKQDLDNPKKVQVISISIMIGSGVLMVPGEALLALPGAVQSLLHNGLVVGVLAAIVLDQWIARRDDRKPLPGKSS